MEKVSQCRKKRKGGRTLWDFSTPILWQISKIIEGDGQFGGNFFFEKKSHNADKNWKGGPFSLAWKNLGQQVQFKIL